MLPIKFELYEYIDIGDYVISKYCVNNVDIIYHMYI